MRATDRERLRCIVREQVTDSEPATDRVLDALTRFIDDLRSRQPFEDSGSAAAAIGKLHLDPGDVLLVITDNDELVKAAIAACGAVARIRPELAGTPVMWLAPSMDMDVLDEALMARFGWYRRERSAT